MQIAAGHDLEVQRLVNQAQSWEPESEELFDRIGIQPGWRCVDLGCGPMGVLEPLSRRVGSMGSVIGMDKNEYCIREAKLFVRRRRLSNVEIIAGDIHENQLEPHSFDLSHIRFVFSQQQCDSEKFEKIRDLTRKGGIMISQESDWETWECDPPQPAWTALRNVLKELFLVSGGDINAGRRTKRMFLDTGIRNVQTRSAILKMPEGHPFRNGMLQFALSMRNQILDAGILSKSEFGRLIVECDAISRNPDIMIFSFTLVQVWGWVS